MSCIYLKFCWLLILIFNLNMFRSCVADAGETQKLCSVRRLNILNINTFDQFKNSPINVLVVLTDDAVRSNLLHQHIMSFTPLLG